MTLVKPQARVLRSVPEPEVMGGVCPGSAPQMPPALSVLAGVWPPLLPSHLCVGAPSPAPSPPRGSPRPAVSAAWPEPPDHFCLGVTLGRRWPHAINWG